jgi:cell wall hydrolase
MSKVVSEAILASLNIWMEARGESWEGKCAVGEVMRNRLRSGSFGKTLPHIILSPYQFSGWNTKDPNRISAFLLEEDNPAFQECLRAWMASEKTDYARGATFYYNPKVVRDPPNWASPAKFTTQVGSHFFYRG